MGCDCILRSWHRLPVQMDEKGYTGGGGFVDQPFFVGGWAGIAGAQLRSAARRNPGRPDAATSLLRRRRISWLMGVREMRHLPDFAAIWRNRPRDEKAKIRDEHLGAAEANVGGLLESVRDISRRRDAH